MEVGVDRISLLPEHVLHHILNSLPTQDAIQISPTCKRLNEVWMTLPYLDFGKDFFPILPDDEHVEKDTQIGDYDEEVNGKNILKDKLTTRINFVEQILSRKMMLNLTIHKFQLYWTHLDDELAQNLDRWIPYLVQHCNINELALEGKGCYTDRRYNLPHILFTATSLRALKLSCCSMPTTSVTLPLPALKKLTLKYISLNENTLLDIINNCRYLEDLEVIYCSGFRKRISLAPPRHSRLRNLCLQLSILEDVDDVIIEAYNLEKLRYCGYLRPATINIIANYDASLKFLFLSGVNITNAWFCELISRLRCLEELVLMQLNLKAIEISSSSLKRLSLLHLFDYRDIKFGEFKIDTPNLVSLVYSGTLSSVFQNSLAVKKVDIRFDEFKRRNRTFEQLCSDVMQFLHKFDHSEVVMVECTFFEYMILPLEKRMNLHTPLAHIKHLILRGKFRGAPIDVLADVFKGARWIAPNLDSLSLERQRRGDHIDLIKFTAGQCDCSTSPKECLKKCRSRTKFEVEGAADDAVAALRNYLYQEAGNHDDHYVKLNRFVRGDQYATALALLNEGKVVLGVLACPNLPLLPVGGSESHSSDDKLGCLFYAEVGEGTEVQSLDGSEPVKVHASTTENPEEASFFESVEAAHSMHDLTSNIAKKLGVKAPPVRIDSQAKYGALSRGDGAIYLRFPHKGYREKIWDHAAGSIVVTEAGAVVTDAAGNILDFSKGRYLDLDTGIIVTNQKLMPLLLKAVRESLQEKKLSSSSSSSSSSSL